MKIKNCRNCKHSHLTNLFSLGKMSFTGKFPKSSSGCKKLKPGPIKIPTVSKMKIEGNPKRHANHIEATPSIGILAT